MSKKGKRNTIRLISFITAAFVIVSGYGIYERQLAGKYKANLNYTYERALNDVTQNVQQIGSSLESGLSAQSPSQIVTLASEVWRLSGESKSSLSSLPLSDYNLEQLEKYFTQAGDYLYVMAKDVVTGKTIADGVKKNIGNLLTYTNSLYKGLTDINNQYNTKKVSFQDIVDRKRLFSFEKKLPDVGKLLSDGVTQIEPYSSLIYDGAFSDHITSEKPIFAAALKDVDRETARKAAATFLDIPASDLKDSGVTMANIYTYDFTTDSLTISVSKSGGRVVLLLKNKAGGEEKVSVKDAMTRASETIARSNFGNMEPVLVNKSGGVLYINYVYNDNGILCYPDLIQVEVCLNTGTICAFDSMAFMTYHREHRNLAMPDMDKAEKALSKNFIIQDANPAVILNDANKEVLTVAYNCTTKDGGRYIVFINKNGEEEKIVKITGSEGGNFLS